MVLRYRRKREWVRATSVEDCSHHHVQSARSQHQWQSVRRRVISSRPWICNRLVASVTYWDSVTPVSPPHLTHTINQPLTVNVKKVKAAHTRLPSIRYRGLIPALGSQPAGDVSHKPGGRLPLLSTRPAVTPATLKRAATNFAAW